MGAEEVRMLLKNSTFLDRERQNRLSAAPLTGTNSKDIYKYFRMASPVSLKRLLGIKKICGLMRPLATAFFGGAGQQKPWGIASTPW
jgi:hypothetical protein